MINLQFLFLSCMSVYSFILGRSSVATSDIVASSVHLKLKYHNLQGEPTIINGDLKWGKIIYQVLQQDQRKGLLMEINMSSLIG